MKRFMNKKVAAIGLAAGLALGAAGAAFAYFQSTGNGTGSATVGSASTWSVVKASSAGTLYPCQSSFPQTSACATSPTNDQATITYTVTNNSTGAQLLTYTNLKTLVDSAQGTEATPLTDIVTGGSNTQPNADTYSTSNLGSATAVNNCQASWFNSTVTSLNGAQADVDVAGLGTATVVVTVGMIDSGTVQNACETQTPDVDLWVS